MFILTSNLTGIAFFRSAGLNAGILSRPIDLSSFLCRLRCMNISKVTNDEDNKEDHDDDDDNDI
jgi:hypothetical protein